MKSDPLQDALAWLQEELPRFDDGQIVLDATANRKLLEERLELEPAKRPILDAAFRDWIYEGRLLTIQKNPVLYRLALDRIVEANYFAQFLAANNFHSSAESKESMLCFLLIQYWAMNGFVRLRDRLWLFGKP